MMKTVPAKKLRTQSGALLEELKKERTTLLTDSQGRRAAYLVDPATFDSLQTRMRLLEGLARGERAIREGRTVTHAQAKKRLSRWLKG
jgi:predicted transcriptional regulator